MKPSPALTPPPGNPRFELADSLRGIALICIITVHAFFVTGVFATEFTPIVIELAIALQVFFILSGFLLYRPFASARAKGKPVPSVRTYFRRRVLRIVPAYWLALAGLGLTIGLYGLWANWLPIFTLTQIYTDRPLQGIGAAWSLAVEVRCYLFLPIFALIARRLYLRGSWVAGELAVIGAVIVLFEVVRVIHYLEPSVFGGLPLMAIPVIPSSFAIGMGLAVLSAAFDDPKANLVERLSSAHEVVARRPGLVWGGALVFFLIASFVFRGYSGIVELPGTYPAIGGVSYLGDWWAGLVVALLFALPALFAESAGGWVRTLLASRTLTWLGVISYGAYLWHWAIQRELYEWVFSDFSQDPATLAVVVVGGVGAVIAGALSYYGVELYFLRRKEPRRNSRREPIPAPAAAARDPR
jgi:peptidoglycan/LPS O-acetylase OafA/YrhL